MPSPDLFDAAAWIRQNYWDAELLEPQTLGVVANFTLMWSLFETTLCGNDATVPKISELALRRVKDQSALQDIDVALRFWRARYLGKDGVFNHLFIELWGDRVNPRRGDVEALPLGQRDEPGDRLLAAMMIVYRLRNNLFHGMKGVAELRDQVRNLDTACRALAGIMKAVGAEGLKS